MKGRSCDSHDLAFLKPCCKSYKILFESRCFIMLLVIICFISLQQMHVTLLVILVWQIHINDKGVLNLLNSLNPHKACGPDNINSRVMKDLKDQDCISIEYTIFFQWTYARVVLSNAFEVAKKLFWFTIRVLMLIGVFNG
jgi:hypothetical protein